MASLALVVLRQRGRNSVQIEINDGLDLTQLGQTLATNRRLQIENILTPASAEAILAQIIAIFY